MRKITEKAIKAFTDNKPFRLQNTEVICEDAGTSLYLHGNKIAKKVGDDIYISNGGWGVSRTTQERLNGFLNVHVRTIKGSFFLNKNPWNGEWTRINKEESI